MEEDVGRRSERKRESRMITGITKTGKKRKVWVSSASCSELCTHSQWNQQLLQQLTHCWYKEEECQTGLCPQVVFYKWKVHSSAVFGLRRLERRLRECVFRYVTGSDPDLYSILFISTDYLIPYPFPILLNLLVLQTNRLSLVGADDGWLLNFLQPILSSAAVSSS